MSNRSKQARVTVLFVALDLVYLYWLWAHFPRWGIWDWDLQESLLEAARVSIVEYGQLPLWNPFLGGGSTLVGHPLGRTFNPSFLPVLLLGTIPGIKVAILLYLGVAQWGMLRLCRAQGLGWSAAVLGAALFSFGGCFAQHLTHGHFEWLAYAWLPWIVCSLERVAAPRPRGADPSRASTAGATAVSTLSGGLFLALCFLDGGPYHYCFVPLFLVLYAVILSAQHRSPRPLFVCAAIGGVGAGLAAIQIVPVVETVLVYPRPTPQVVNYARMPSEPSLGQMLVQGYLSRAQAHDPAKWMPFVLNVGSYVGPLPLLLAVLALVGDRARAWPIAAVGLLSACIAFSAPLPVDVWSFLHRLPGFSSLKVPVRFNLFVLMALSVLAARGLDVFAGAVHTKFVHGQRARRAIRLVFRVLVALVVADLFVVHVPVFKVAFSVDPIRIREPGVFSQYGESPYRSAYVGSALYDIWPNWPSATFPTILENRGVIDSYLDMSYPRQAIAADAIDYPGREAWAADQGVEVASVKMTPNAIAVRCEGSGGRVVVNQNHHWGWNVAGEGVGPVENSDGRLSVRVPPGPSRFVLEFRPASFRVGVQLTLLSAVAALAVLALVRVGAQARRAG